MAGILRTILGVGLILFGLASFPYPREDRHKIGLALGCIAFVLGGVLSLWTSSWIPIPAALALGFAIAAVLPARTPPAGLAIPDEVAAAVLAESGASDNFKYIALNMALIRYALESGHGDRFPDDETLYVACGVCDTLAHIDQGHFTVQDVRDAMSYAQLGQCHLDLATRVQHEGSTRAFMGGTDLFLNYTLQIEAMIFWADECFVDPIGLSAQDIILAVLDKKDDISRVLQTPRKALARSRDMAGVRQAVAGFMKISKFADIRTQIGLQ